jgi:hypothetical protein
MPAFTVAKLKPLFALVDEVCQELKKHIDNNKHTGTAVKRTDISVHLLFYRIGTQVSFLEEKAYGYCF